MNLARFINTTFAWTRQVVATAVMGAALWLLMPLLWPYFSGGVLNRIWSLTVLVGTGMAVFFAAAYLIGAIDPDLVAMLRRRRPTRDERDDEILEVQ